MMQMARPAMTTGVVSAEWSRQSHVSGEVFAFASPPGRDVGRGCRVRVRFAKLV